MPRGGARAGAGRPTRKEKFEQTRLNPPEHPAPSPSDPVIIEQARNLAELGATDFEIARFFHINRDTLHQWRFECSEFSDAIRVGKGPADDRVEMSLYHRSVGYTYASVKIFMPASRETPVYAPYDEHVPPDVAAAKHWLNNRRGAEWREKAELAIKYEEAELTDAELAEIIRLGRRARAAGEAGS